MRKILAVVSFIIFAPSLTLAASCPNLTQDMWLGSCDQSIDDSDCARHVTGNQVTQLQQFLIEYYDNPNGLWTSGYFGVKTQGFVTRFQADWDIPTTGRVGPLTRAAVSQACVNTTSPSPSPSPMPPPPPPPPTTTYSWDIGMWNSCTNSQQTRTVQCKNAAGTVVADSFCTGMKPVTSQSCPGGGIGQSTIAATQPASSRLLINLTADVRISDITSPTGAVYINWGDGNTNEVQKLQSYSDTRARFQWLNPATSNHEIPHTYANPGTYTITIAQTITPTTVLASTVVTITAHETTAPSATHCRYYDNWYAEGQTIEEDTTACSVASPIARKMCDNGYWVGVKKACGDTGGTITGPMCASRYITEQDKAKYNCPASGTLPATGTLHGNAPFTVDLRNLTTSCQLSTGPITCDLATIHWGDGTTLGFSGLTSSRAHTYTTPGVYTIRIQKPNPQLFGDPAWPSYDSTLNIRVDGVSITYSWSAGTWGTCTNGQQTRTVQCKSNTGAVVADSFCTGTKPTEMQNCTTSGSLSGYSASPLSGAAPLEVTFTRPYLGQGYAKIDFGDGQSVPAASSFPSESMRVIRHVYTTAGTYAAKIFHDWSLTTFEQYSINVTGGVGTYSWSTGTWGTCTNSQQTRAVQCKSNTGTVVADSYCVGTVKPASSQTCPVSSQSCTLDGVTLASGQSRIFYLDRLPGGPSIKCSSSSLVRTCSNGVLSGDASYQYATCGVSALSPDTSNASQLASAYAALVSVLQALIDALK